MSSDRPHFQAVASTDRNSRLAATDRFLTDDSWRVNRSQSGLDESKTRTHEVCFLRVRPLQNLHENNRLTEFFASALSTVRLPGSLRRMHLVDFTQAQAQFAELLR